MTDIKTLKTLKNPKLIICECCDFKCINKKDFNKHLMTVKHKKNTERLQDADIKNPLKCICECGNEYFHRQSLSKHKKQCNFGKKKYVELQEPEPNNKIIDLLIANNKQLQDDNREIKELFMKLYNENKEQTKISQEQNQVQTAAILELTKNGINTTNNITNNTTNKPTFNLNFFLNDTCKDAMNLTDFINSIQLTYKDFIKVGCEGYVKGISDIININLKKLAEIERPIHCTDEKRGTLYIKDDNKWEKAEDNKKINKFIGTVANKSARERASYVKEFPDCTKSRSRYSDQLNKCTVEAMGGAGDNEDEKKDKITRSILKSVLIKTK
jgi:hypothetical protein